MNPVADIAVFGQLELEEYLLQHPRAFSDFDLISIGNPKSETRRNPGSTLPRVISKRFRNILRLAFWDIERPDLLGNLTPPVLAQPADIQRIIEFYERSETKKIVVHCWAGISRSAATALCLLYLDEHNAQEALNKLLVIRPQAAPLMRIIKIFDQLKSSQLETVVQSFLVSYYEKMKQDLDLNEDSLLEELKDD